MLEIKQEELDRDEFLLNTSSASYDLRKGIEFVMGQNASHHITKQKKVGPSDIVTDECIK